MSYILFTLLNNNCQRNRTKFGKSGLYVICIVDFVHTIWLIAFCKCVRMSLILESPNHLLQGHLTMFNHFYITIKKNVHGLAVLESTTHSMVDNQDFIYLFIILFIYLKKRTMWEVYSPTNYCTLVNWKLNNIGKKKKEKIWKEKEEEETKWKEDLAVRRIKWSSAGQTKANPLSKIKVFEMRLSHWKYSIQDRKKICSYDSCKKSWLSLW